MKPLKFKFIMCFTLLLLIQPIYGFGHSYTMKSKASNIIKIEGPVTLPPTVMPYPGPPLDEWWWIYIPSPDAQLEAMLAGEIHTMPVDRPEDYKILVENGFQIVQYLWPGEGGIWFNTRHSPTNDTRFRQAIAHLIPYDELISQIWGPLSKREVAHLNPGFTKYYNPNVPVYEYDPSLAAWLLDQAGYTINPETGKRINPLTGEDLRPLKLVYCSEWPDYVAFMERVATELENVGFSVELSPTDFAGWYTICLQTFEFDITIISWGWSTGLPDALYLFYHSSQIGPGQLNFPGFSNSTLDYYLDIITSSINETEVVWASHKAQEILAEQLPMIPCWSTLVTEAWHPDLIGLVAPGHLRSNIFRQLLFGPRWPKIGGVVKSAAAAQPSNLNPIHELYGAGNEVIIMGGGWTAIEYHLWSGRHTSWVIKDWKIEAWSNETLNVQKGMKITLWIREGVYWHDGWEYTAEDVVFALLYLKDVQNPMARKLWKDLIDARVINKYKCEVYFNVTSIFLLDYIGEYGARLPKHIWNPNVTRYGEPPGIPEGSYEGQVGYGVRDYTIFLPYKVQNPYMENLTCLVGVGAWIFPPGGWIRDVSVKLVANRRFFRTVVFTDVNADFKVDIKDIIFAAKALGAFSGHERWTSLIDFNGDHKISIKDLAVIAKDFGRTW